MTIPAFPLQWPAGWPREQPEHRAHGKFGTVKRERQTWSDGSSHEWKRAAEISIAGALKRVRDSLQRMGFSDDDIVISSNLKLRLDGDPMSSQREPDDPGVAVYWRTIEDETRCMAIDQYRLVAHNLAAIAATLEVMRAIERHGGAEILDRAFTGFTALAPPAGAWWEVLGVPRSASGAEIEAAYRRRRSETHPDRAGGSAEAFTAVQRAFEQANAQ